MRMTVELIDSPEELNPGDIIIYASLGNFFTAQLEKKPVRDTRYQGWHKATRCKVPIERKMIDHRYFKNGQPIFEKIEYTYETFSFENFEKVKYINFTNKSIFKILMS